MIMKKKKSPAIATSRIAGKLVRKVGKKKVLRALSTPNASNLELRQAINAVGVRIVLKKAGEKRRKKG
jgi:hypothetical protein